MEDQQFYNVLAVGMAVAVVLSFFGAMYGSQLGSSGPSGTSSGMPNGSPASFTLKAFMTGFLGVGGAINGVRDPTLAVGWGDTVTITVIDGEATVHNFHLDGYNLQMRNLTKINDSASVNFRATIQGDFAYYCAIPGHREAGMEGTLVVGTPTAPTIAPELPLSTSRISQNASAIPPLITRNYSTTVNIYLHAVEVTAEIEPGVSYQYWTYNGTVPGPFFRVRVGDTVVVHFSNDKNDTMNHSVDFHAATGPGGGASLTQTPPGGEKTFSFLAMTPGLFVYHCGTPNIPTHIANGMFGMILVQPALGMPAVDHEFYMMESEMYLQWPLHTLGNQMFNGTALLNNDPTYVVFNGAYDSLTKTHALKVKVNDTIRLFFGEAGPNDFSAFHMIGSMFNQTYLYGDLTDPPMNNLQTVPVPPGSTAMMVWTAMYPGNYSLVDHQIVNAIDKGALAILNVTGWANTSIFHTGSTPPAPYTLSGSYPDIGRAILARMAPQWSMPGVPSVT
jgi:nitrite reductase (NO-forming)